MTASVFRVSSQEFGTTSGTQLCALAINQQKYNFFLYK